MRVSRASRSPRAAWIRRRSQRPLRPPARARAGLQAKTLSSSSSAQDSVQESVKGSMNQHLRLQAVPFIDVAAQRQRLGKAIDEAIARVLDHCQFINGPEVMQLEADLAAYSGARHVVTCASGTDALLMVLMAKGVGRGDAVLCPSFTFCATGEVVVLTGATPVFVDVDESTFNMDIGSLKRGIAAARKAG